MLNSVEGVGYVRSLTGCDLYWDGREGVGFSFGVWEKDGKKGRK